MRDTQKKYRICERIHRCATEDKNNLLKVNLKLLIIISNNARNCQVNYILQ